MLVQHLRHPLERIDVRPGFWGLEWSCPSPWEVPEGIREVPFHKITWNATITRYGGNKHRMGSST